MSGWVSRSLRVVVGMVLLVWAGNVVGADSTVDFKRDIKPILDESCVSCHGPQKQKGALRLDAREAAMKGGTTGVSIVPGKGNASLLVQRVLG